MGAHEVGRFVERFASTLADAGFPRLAARVFATLLVSDEGRMTAAELARALRASTGGVSGAVRYLVQVRLIRVEREPGTRRHAYVVDGSWYEATVTGNPFLDRARPISGPASPRSGAPPRPGGWPRRWSSSCSSAPRPGP
ncbi:hypothetical protein Asp14428_05980 [Actinoplanes sp. NBRC 14428]|nr:hypothetical protein Asp14428_05980 [Actinoplanes sp. NBRC 14428]